MASDASRHLKIAFYAPFKPISHPNPSGDLTIARGLVRHFTSRGHEIRVASALRTRHITQKPWVWPLIPLHLARAVRVLRDFRPDIWLTYHTYYKAPDILGPLACRMAGVPYVIFQGIYSTKRRRDVKTWPGFVLNRRALLSARLVFTNRREDETNLLRLLPPERVRYAPPGIYPEGFVFTPEARARHREEWGAGDRPVVLSAAMFRPGVKADGLSATLRVMGALALAGERFLLVIAGDGEERERLHRLAEAEVPGRFLFIGLVPRKRLQEVYSAADLFVFPGIRESLGMVYLEAQSCRLPVAAYDNGGIPEVVARDKTGFLTPLHDESALGGSVLRLLRDPALRERMGRTAEARVRERHDLSRNYRIVEEDLRAIAAGGRRK
jgi:glycosyltransferase involved in cell wall biosynthesis